MLLKFSSPQAFVRLVLLAVGSRTLCSTSASNTSRASLTVRRSQGKIDVLLRVSAYAQRGHIHDLLTNTDVSLSNQNTGVVDGLRYT